MPSAYNVRRLREFDRNVMHGGRQSSERVLEPVPFCWMCPSQVGNRTREHVFARQLLDEFPAEMAQFEPIRYTSIVNGAQVGDVPRSGGDSGRVAGVVDVGEPSCDGQ